MMFTKMMIVVDGDVNIQDNLAVAKYISENTDPATDFVFSQGPTDVLDHSCSTMAFGGKMGIDATKKHPEELAGKNISSASNDIPDSSILTTLFPEITDVNPKLLHLGISVLFIAVHKNRKGHVKELAHAISQLQGFNTVKVLIFLEHTLEVSDIADAVWRFSNNVDPKRDHIVTPAGTIAFDGTRKTKEFDGFSRDWPNILASDEATISHIDSIWNKLGLGPFIESPSKKYRKQLYKGGAVVEE